MVNFILLFGLIALEIISLYIFEDFFSPMCLVCESFLLAFICSYYSSSAESWNFDLHLSTVAIILLGLLFIFFGSCLAKSTKTQNNKILKIKFIEPGKYKIIIMLVVQVLILGIYLIYYRKSTAQFGGMDWNSMIRAYRFTASYGDGLDVGMPSWVSQLTKISRANAYICLYILVHNLVIHKHIKRKMPYVVALCINVILYLPYNLLNAARFELLVILVFGIIVWYTYYKRYASLMGTKRASVRKAIKKISLIVIGAMIGFSAIAPLVGRVASKGIITQAANYFGRTLQAFDNFVQKPEFNSGFENKESLYCVVKLLKQLHFIDGDIDKFYLKFTFQDDYSLGNTYTLFRRYYADFGIIGVILMSFFVGFILTFLYRKCLKPSFGQVNFGLVIYSTIIFAACLSCYEDFIFSTMISTNYLIIFVCLYIVSKWVNNKAIIKSHQKIKGIQISYE